MELTISAAFLTTDIENSFATVSVRSQECELFNKNSSQNVVWSYPHCTISIEMTNCHSDFANT